MFGETKPWVRSTIVAWTAAVVVFMYLPIVTIIMASFVKSRYFRLPVRAWDTRWYEEALTANIMRQLHWTSFSIAVWVAVIAVFLGFFGALAFARYDYIIETLRLKQAAGTLSEDDVKVLDSWLIR